MAHKEIILSEKYECMGSDEKRQIQSEKLTKVVKRCYDNVPFYKAKFDEIGLKPEDIKGIDDIGKIPFITKEDLRDNYPTGLWAADKKDIVRIQGTSGTTGKLTIVGYTKKDVEVWGECVGRCLTMAGLTNEDIIHVCYGYGLFTGGLGADFGGQRIGALTVPMSAGNTQRQLMMMEDMGATALACTPSYALNLGEAVASAGIKNKLKLKAGIHGAEPWTEEMKKKIDELLGIDAYDIYGLCEITGPGVAQDCQYHCGLHIHDDFFYPEVLDPVTHEPVPDGQLGELVFTTLDKEGMPMLRYRTKDLTSITHEKCVCGRTTPRISKFKGRTDDMKVIRGVNVFPTQVETVLLAIGGDVSNHYFMIVDRENNADRLTVQVEISEAAARDKARYESCRIMIAEKLKQALGISVIVDLKEPGTLARSEGKAKRVQDNRGLV